MSDPASNSRSVKDFALGLGASLVGIADVSSLREGFLLDAKTAGCYPFAVSLAKRLSDGVIEDIADCPTTLYFHHYRQMNFFLDRAAFLLADYLQGLGHAAIAIPASQIIDWENQRAHVSHKHVGVLAGLGWFGRNNLLVNPELGARFRLVTVLTDMPLAADAPLEGDCGSCRDCVAECPAGAIGKSREDFDHQACFEKLKDFRKRGLVSQFICGVCVKACRGRAARPSGS